MTMETTVLGRTGLRVSVAGLGCGGHSRLGLAAGLGDDHVAGIVRAAIDLGITFVDTAESYGTEPAVGLALRQIPRVSVVVSTKLSPRVDGRLCTGAELIARLEGTLRRLGTDHVDILHLHGVAPDEYPHCRAELAPALATLKAQGKIRFPGITEVFARDPGHTMLPVALADDLWDVVMVGVNVLNPSARERVLATTAARGVGTLCMFAVRRALSRPDALRELVADLAARNLLGEAVDPDDPLGFLTAPGVAATLPEAAYRFCRHLPGMDVVLTGTGNPEHLRENVRSILGPPLPGAVLGRLERIFGDVDCVSGN